MSETICFGCQNTLEDPVILDWCNNTWCRQWLIDKDRIKSQRQSDKVEEGSEAVIHATAPYQWLFWFKRLTLDEVQDLPSNKILNALLGIKSKNPS